ncbi:MAG: hypothetical protein JJU02_01610 [Cryomorphaceae bacterium]|nr:hypothetical protein [Cryomorphaceae bacterium]
MRILILLVSFLFTGCVGSQLYNPSLMIPGEDLAPGQVKINVSGGPAPFTHRDDVQTFEHNNYTVLTGEPVSAAYDFLGDVNVQVGLFNNNTLQLRSWSDFAFNRWGLSIGNLYWIHNDKRFRQMDWGIQPSFAVVGDKYSAQGWGVQVAGVGRYRYNEKLALYGGVAPLYGRIPNLPVSYMNRAEELNIANPRPDGLGLGVHLGFEYVFADRFTGRIDINVIGQQDLYYRDFSLIPCFTLGFGYTLFKE